ncbi:4a-hydroxytetrahydrobiopterin dehydratase (PCD) [Prochlorococcus marinus str. MIT 9515]|uniref:Putative pterin-4-alpha-carbinolamine dehydratase n=1 Tax=Prochlorococcus marinus (strain MIT 9515) TaxID=167542 RepID=PHS_PROM5|nr:4a-hydroxytetrahydrobiopterin dehydratase [Prochlorococcus marinus]A2BVF3.1 RecName: Full=Putative pterin-4-alpha-carbinolamine dehydratase; Short=PHS; AltName: Full=4-alpha-hydroxy-tetrahydropterin dehydratase; AltName: Full=Pterin carbinolamine dehydratase; Short=PCD [Prochlorococcus marinus str. MIT 9515]ABM71764.1 4a-hydroxytetrahydrobiopterin dehydratase (PCD) [Prochlorococcus marinus str. MIT 9515]
MKPHLLQNEELKELIAKIPGWEIISNHLEREFNFGDFIEAFSFMTKIALICEKYNHHPNWENVYSKVIIKLSTHDLGGITNLDQKIASEINEIFEK